MEEAICQRSVSESLESEAFENSKCLVKFVFGEVAIGGAVSKGFPDKTNELIVLLAGIRLFIFSI